METQSYNTYSIVQEIERLLKVKALWNEVHRFPSGAAMIDIRHNDQFIVIQVCSEYVGYSIIDENTGIDSRPDNFFKSEAEFWSWFGKL